MYWRETVKENFNVSFIVLHLNLSNKRLVFPQDCCNHDYSFKHFTWLNAIMLNKDNAQDTNLLNNEWAVCKTPLIMWKSPLSNFATSSYKKEICTKCSIILNFQPVSPANWLFIFKTLLRRTLICISVYLLVTSLSTYQESLLDQSCWQHH